MIQRRQVLSSAVAGVMLSAIHMAHAQSGKTIRIVVPFAAGGVQDILARSISIEMGQALGQTVIVENRAGAGGTIGTSYVAKAESDGTVMVMAAASHNIAGSLYTKLNYDPQ
jgi:tripartite-type tricarboxylate transporter receptor subunit TctC